MPSLTHDHGVASVGHSQEIVTVAEEHISDAWLPL